MPNAGTGQIASCLTRHLNNYGIHSSFAKPEIPATRLLPCHFLFTVVKYKQRVTELASIFTIRTVGDLGLRLANDISTELFDRDRIVQVKTSCMQHLYNAFRVGVIPIDIIFPDDILLNDGLESACNIIAHATRDFTFYLNKRVLP